ncbi:hypothetical protein [Undibacterium danionis]|uniref:Uncharacterized protein n=1 Tax=Undibacterium danionis TaxID=1812100 RepID=A0ABV6ICW3_9BURK
MDEVRSTLATSDVFVVYLFGLDGCLVVVPKQGLDGCLVVVPKQVIWFQAWNQQLSGWLLRH